MHLMGWCPQQWDPSQPLPPYETLVSLAGNAFNAWACAPAFLALLQACGRCSAPQLHKPLHEPEPGSHCLLYTSPSPRDA
eukprot:10079131-Lingulodinium_polyedra.AAC.1